MAVDIQDKVVQQPENRRLNFFGALVDPLGMNETLERVEQLISERKITQHVVINVAKLVMMQKDAELKSIVNSCGLINADGQGIVWGARLLGYPLYERVAGIDLFLKIAEIAPKKGWRLYFLGAKEEILNRVVHILKEKNPGLEVAGYQDGYFKVTEEAKVAQEIRDSRADVLFVAMPSPRKEVFLNRYVDLMQVPFVMGVGGSFDVVAGFVRRAPLWMQRAGLEWLFRLLSEPGRMWKRYLSTNLAYGWMLVKALCSGKGKYRD